MNVDEPLSGLLRETVAQMCATAVPHDSLTRTLERAAAIRLPRRSERSWRMAAYLCAACLALVLAGTWAAIAWLNQPVPADPVPVVVAPPQVDPPPRPEPPSPKPEPPPAPEAPPVNPFKEFPPMIEERRRAGQFRPESTRHDG